MSTPRPSDLDGVPLVELATAWQRQADDFEGTGPRSRARATALAALTIATAVINKLSFAQWPTVRVAIEHGAQLADIAAALDEAGDIEIVAERFRTYLDALSIDGRITDQERAELERRLSPHEPARLKAVQ